jgi:hypothetical protein
MHLHIKIFYNIKKEATVLWVLTCYVHINTHFFRNVYKPGMPVQSQQILSSSEHGALQSHE